MDRICLTCSSKKSAASEPARPSTAIFTLFVLFQVTWGRRGRLALALRRPYGAT